MPFIYTFSSKTIGNNYTTHGTPDTEIDVAFIKPGAAWPVSLLSLRVFGKGAALTTASAIAFRLKKWTTTASSGGTTLAAEPTHIRSPAISATQAAGTGAGTNAVTSGTGGPALLGAFGCNAAGPGGLVPVKDEALITLDGNQNKSIDLFSASGTASLNFEFSGELQE